MEVIFHRLAAQEYNRALLWYARRSQSAARRFERGVEEAMRLIGSTPQLGTPYDQDHRSVPVRRFPYRLFYTAASSTQIVIVAVAHTSRRPGYWRRRHPGV